MSKSLIHLKPIILCTNEFYNESKNNKNQHIMYKVLLTLEYF